MHHNMNSEDKLFLVLKRPSLEEMQEIMNKFHQSNEYLEGPGLAPDKSARKLREFGWYFKEYCRAIGTME